MIINMFFIRLKLIIMIKITIVTMIFECLILSGINILHTSLYYLISLNMRR